MKDLVTDEAVGPDGAAAATFSADRRYRYLLTRCWDPSKNTINFLMLNPSVADAFKVDPTVRRCILRAQALGYGGVHVTNLFAFRATKPADMKAEADPVGPRNDEAIRLALRNSHATVCAWGLHGQFRGREGDVLAMLRATATPLDRLYRIGPPNKGGSPGHPLFRPAAMPLEEYL